MVSLSKHSGTVWALELALWLSTISYMVIIAGLFDKHLVTNLACSAIPFLIVHPVMDKQEVAIVRVKAYVTCNISRDME